MGPSVFEKTVAGIPFTQAIRVRLIGSEAFYGPGVAHLMELIAVTGSVAGACDKMGLSYSKGRTMIRRMERELGFPVVERAQGGAGGGGARLTDRGRKLLAAYQAYEADVKQYAQERFADAFRALAEEEGQP